MKKQIISGYAVLIIVIFHFIHFNIYSQTNVSGIITSNTVWDTTGSPYLITGNTIIPDSVTLEIKPGVQVLFPLINKRIDVYGTLTAIGTATDSIIFSDTTNYGFINFYNTCSDYDSVTGYGTQFSYCKFLNNAIYSDNSCDILFSHCNVDMVSGISMYQYDNIYFIENKINSSIRLCSGSNSVFIGNIFIEDCLIGHEAGGAYTGGGIGSCSDLGDLTFKNNIFYEFSVELSESGSNIFCNNTFTVSVLFIPISNSQFQTYITNNTFTTLMHKGSYPIFISCIDFSLPEKNIVIKNNIFYPDTMVAVSGDCNLSPGAFGIFDLSNNYWGGKTNSQIDSGIYDYNDDVIIGLKINYLPTLSVPSISGDCSSFPVNTNFVQKKKEFYCNIYPNPSSEGSTIEYLLPQGTKKGELIITDITGREVKKILLNDVQGTITLDNSRMQAGTYFYQLKSNSFLITKKMVVVK